MTYRDDGVAALALAEAAERGLARVEAQRLALGLHALRDEVAEKRAQVAALRRDIEALRDAAVPARRLRAAVLFTCAAVASCLGPLFASLQCP
ncbi:MAG TPA: hypothetical protein VKE22_01800 [Haliangiales bacterium]|nr:hypothetical protein [Haliangiales bacterium]